MRFGRLLVVAVTLLSALPSEGQQDQPPTVTPQTPLVRTTSQEVLLDVVVRDKRRRLVKNLSAKDFQLIDDGEPQTIRSFRQVTRAETPAEGASGPGPAGLDPFRQIRIITLVFDHLGLDARNRARIAVEDLLKMETGPNLFFAVFSVEWGLSIFQPYTADKELVRKAVGRATSSAASYYRSDSDQIEEELATTPQGGSPASTALAQLARDMLTFSRDSQRGILGGNTLFALEPVISLQHRLPGRKTLLFFSEGVYVPPAYREEFQGLISSANRANVSVYGIDAGGLSTLSPNFVGGSLLSQAAEISLSQQVQSDGPVTYDRATALEWGDTAIPANSQSALREISERTGGFLIANSNNLRTNIRRVSEDVDTHYELAYSPNIGNFDGHFRKIVVHVKRSKVSVQSRSGYYALPFVPGVTLLPYELPMLNALAAPTLPRDIPFRSLGLHFKSSSGEPLAVVVFDVPLEDIEFTRDEVNRLYQAHFSVLALFKDAQGSVVRKLSQDVPRVGSLSTLDSSKAGHFFYSNSTPIPPGRYTFETAVCDRNSGKVSAQKTFLLISPPAKSLGISSLVRVRSFSAMDPAEPVSGDNPFRVEAGRISPGIGETFKADDDSVLSIFFTVYVEPESQANPLLQIDFLQDGRLIYRGQPDLPAPDSNGLIPYIASTPLGFFKPGQYEVRVTATLDGKVATERTLLVLE